MLRRKTLDEQRDDLRSLHLQFFVVVSQLPHSTGKVSPKIVTGGKNRPALLCDHIEAIGQSISAGLVAHVGPDLHLTISWVVSIDSDIAEGIVRMAENGEQVTNTGGAEWSDLIAMTIYGATGLHRWTVGSITERVLHATRLPLLIVRPADMIEKERRQRASQEQATR